MARPLQLIRCGDESDNYAFVLNEQHLDEVTAKCPKGLKVCVVSVVGAFRTGKSFLLTLILRYLRALEKKEAQGDEWLTAEGARIAEGNVNDGGAAADGGAASFEWRGGRNRMTTGITVWSEPFILPGPDGVDVAVIILDTQGLFDNETPMGLTSCIFGLSTLMSSYQIYNVSNRIQEDNLQQLALFTEYGRMAVEADKQAARAAARDVEAASKAAGESPVAAAADLVDDEAKAPFQRLEFLVRDWAEFDEDMTDAQMDAQMATYLAEVLSPRTADDLAFTREQITMCFEKLGCSLLPHPGFAVTKKSYDGEVGSIEPLFKRCVNSLMRRIFAPDALAPKKIGGEALEGIELANYVKAYVGMFADGAKFPQATTMLEATADANNRNALHKATECFTEIMDAACGSAAAEGYLTFGELRAKLEEANAAALEIFHATATMGRKSAVNSAKETLLREIGEAGKRFTMMNDARNPFKNAEFYVVPLAIATASWVMRRVTDAVCPEDGSFVAQTCNRAEGALGQLYGLIIFVMLVAGYGKFKGLFKHVKNVVRPLLAAAASQASS
ncbi:guanylate-binding protein [Pelagophyceae sp. CCMP2097]|nr:guanylate-binding protein [Pelagophyceae sp. CCMP2097]